MSIDELKQFLRVFDEYNPFDGLNEAHLGNLLSMLHQILGHDSWAGIYRLKSERLVLSSFQGTPACEVIKIGKGVVGTSFKEGRTIDVSDVSKLDNYICCDEKAKSEICLPLYDNKKRIVAILDIDLPFIHDFKDEIEVYEDIALKLEKYL